MSYRTERPKRSAALWLPTGHRSIDFTRLDSPELCRRVHELRTAGLLDQSIADLTGLGVNDVRRVLGTVSRMPCIDS